MSLTHLGTYDYNVIEFLALMAFVVAGFLVLRSTTAPVHERLAFIGFFVEVVSASSQFWYSVFGEGRTYVDAYVMAVVLLLATPAGSVAAAVTSGGHASLADRIFAPDRSITSKHLTWLAAVAVAALLVVARRRVLFE
jgi:hypothetical protein